MYNKLLRQLILHAYNTTPYYKELFDKNKIKPEYINTVKDLSIIPITTKEIIQNSPEKFLSKEYKYFPQNENLIIKRTSGSTGKYMKVYWENKDNIRSMFSLWKARNRIYNINPSSKFCSFYTTMYATNKLTDICSSMLFNEGRNLSFNKIGINEKNINLYYQEIYNYQPDWIFVQPSIAFLMADYISKHNLDIPKSLKYIELTGEYLLDSVRKKIESTFMVQIVNQYGCNEANGIAIECVHNNMHCLNDNVITEILNDGLKVNDGIAGDIHITCLTNYAMPFIRYAIGDRGILEEDHNCHCGNKNPTLKLLSGRVSDYILLEDGSKINSYVFLYTIEKVNEQMGSPIMQFQIEQNSIGEFTVNLVIRESFKGWHEAIIKHFLSNIKENTIIKSNWNFNFVDSINPDNLSGKLSFFNNKIALLKED